MDNMCAGNQQCWAAQPRQHPPHLGHIELVACKVFKHLAAPLVPVPVHMIVVIDVVIMGDPLSRCKASSLSHDWKLS